MSFDCGACLSGSENKSFDLVIITDNNYHFGKYCNFDCLKKEVDSLSSSYVQKLDVFPWEILHKDISQFFSGNFQEDYSYLLPSKLVSNPLSVEALSKTFHNCEDPALQKQILCYWISCLEPGANWPDVNNFELVKLPKQMINGSILNIGGGESPIMVVDGDHGFFSVKIKDNNWPLIDMKNVSFSVIETVSP